MLHRRRLACALAVAVTLGGAGAPWLTRAAAAGDPDQSKQWGLATIGAPAAWARSTGAGVRIGIVDTGADLAHEDLAAKIVARADCVGSLGNPAACRAGVPGDGIGQDDNGHGSHVAGIAAAVTGNNKGVAGVAPGAELVVVKALDNDSGTVDDINAGVKWAVDHGARVVNLSVNGGLGGSLLGSGAELTEGIEYAWEHNSLVVLAAGNQNLLGLGGSNYGNVPAVVVGATGHDDKLTGYSSPLGNARWALLAPGGSNDGEADHEVHSTYWRAGQANQYGELFGTSMAAPHVSGTLALLMAGGLSTQAAVDRLLATANRSVTCGSAQYCAGRLDAAAAVASLPAPTSSSTTTTTVPVTATTVTTSPPPTTAPAGGTSIPTPLPPAPGSVPESAGPGYLLADINGRVRGFGSTTFSGQLTSTPNKPIVGGATVPGPAPGYWLVATDGGVFSFGDARFYGSTGARKLNQPIVGMAATPSGRGYWLVATDGGIFSFGDAWFYGSTGAIKLNQPIVGMTPTPNGAGYWLVASDGGIFSFGSARFFGSTGAMKLNQPIIGMARPPAGSGYWLVAADGGIFSFGTAPFLGSGVGSGLGRFAIIAAG